MNLFIISPMSTTPLMLTAEQSTWDRLGTNRETVFFEPSEEADVFIGHCLMIGSAIQFKFLAKPTDISEMDKVYVMSTHFPNVETTLHGKLISLATANNCAACSNSNFSCN